MRKKSKMLFVICLSIFLLLVLIMFIIFIFQSKLFNLKWQKVQIGEEYYQRETKLGKPTFITGDTNTLWYQAHWVRGIHTYIIEYQGNVDKMTDPMLIEKKEKRLRKFDEFYLPIFWQLTGQ